MNIVDFLRDYWQFISTGFVCLLLIIIMIIKKKPVTEIFDKSIVSKVLDLVIQAENLFGKGHGSEKLDFVLNAIKSEYSVLIDDVSIRALVEYVLSSPQKKESLDEKVK